jgi:ABC-2 type transport system permease protein
MRRRTLANLARQGLRRARLRLGVVVVLSAVFWCAVYLLAAESLEFLESTIQHSGTLRQVVGKVFEVFFFSLLLMLVFSMGVMLYGSLYRTAEARLLLTTPARDARIFVHKLQESLLLGGWGTLLMASPLLVAYGVWADAPWHYFCLLGPALAAFVYLPGTAGGLACVVLVRWLPRSGRRLAAALGLVAFVLSAWLAWRALRAPGADLLTPDWFQEMIGRMRFSEHRLLPSWWLSAALFAAAGGDWSEAVLLVTLLFSNALLLHQVTAAVAARLYRAGYSRLYDYQPSVRSRRVVLVDRWLSRVPLVSPALRTLLVKDLRMFRRDPVQWSQFLVFFGLLSLYSLNVRRLSFGVDSAAWVNLISFLNLAVVGLILSTFTTRFIFPLVSLEGRRFWIMGRLPIDRDTILWAKFLFAAVGSLVTCLILVLLGDLMLAAPPLVVAVHLLTCTVLCLGLAGIAVGLGASLPSLREESPARIAAGFGGTLNLVLSTLYIVAVVLLAAVPCHFYVAEAQLGSLPVAISREAAAWWLIGGAAGSVVLGAVAVAVPLWLGLRAFRALEV